ncbi:MAG: signal peptidase I, partial [Phycisphaerales bacterium]|nr:signal peptidase I [Phycisphaerales bacterium]
GSMAPTLLGDNLPFQSDQTGYEWTVNPWYASDGNNAPIQRQVSVTDPMTTNNAAFSVDAPGASVRPRNAPGYILPPRNKRLRPGDRILVLKYIYSLLEPTRFDVVVFKNPADASQNYIKRLVGLPGEEVLIVAGDIFTRMVGAPDDAWAVRRKPRHIQQRLWRPQYSSDYRPLAAADDVGPTPTSIRSGTDPSGLSETFYFSEPWLSDTFRLHEHTGYRNDAGIGELRWNTSHWPVTDRVPYNEAVLSAGLARYPVPDLRMRAGVRPDSAGMSLAARIKTLGHEFSVTIDGGDVRLTRRPLDVDVADRVKAATIEPLPAGKVTNIAFCHVDQSLQLWINDKLVLEDDYDDWSPIQRLQFATERSPDEIMDRQRERELLAPDTYWPNLPEVTWEFNGAVTLYRVGLDRDIYYEPYASGADFIGLATLPSHTAKLNGDQYFCLGDNSPASLDGRGWNDVDKTIAETIDSTRGVVPRKLIIGKAFFVYFPGPHEFAGRTLIPDTGDMRIIH